MVELLLLIYIALAVVVMNHARSHFRGLTARAVLAVITIIMIFAAALLYGAYKARYAHEPTFSIDFIDG